jgi:c-di-GMP-related signal transduction protein
MNSKVFKTAGLQVFDGFLLERPQVLKLGADLSVVKWFDPHFGSRK